MRNKKVEFTLHAEDKLKRLTRIGVTKEKSLEIIENPEKVVSGYYGRKIAQGLLSKDLILRVVYEEREEEIMVITVYPGERRRYE
ncbi:DUF4258 domain-containing protein [ANME-1 cluster archaeon AG-394-G06]|nr:DUF4258 domain-containing protein [ANME-1 cluster archaeon AG-394-G06]